MLQQHSDCRFYGYEKKKQVTGARLISCKECLL